MVVKIKKSQNEFADMVLRNVHMGKSSKLFFDNHMIEIPADNVDVQMRANVLYIYHEDILKAVIDADSIVAVISNEKDE